MDGLDEGGRIRTDATDLFVIEVASTLSARPKTPHSSIPEGVSETLPLLRTRSKVCAIFFPGVPRCIGHWSARARGNGEEGRGASGAWRDVGAVTENLRESPGS